MDVAPTRYVDTDRGAIAYQIVGDGPTTILVNKPVNYPIDLMWDEPSFARFLTGLGSFARCIWFDPLGSGASDAIEVIEDRLGDSVVADMLGLLDSLEQERAFVLGVGYAVPSILLTATHPERVQGLVLFNPVARVRRAPDYPQGIPDELIDAYLEHVRMIEDDDSNPLLLQPSPSLDGNVRFARWFRRCERLATTPNHRVFRLRVSFAADVRGVLPSVRVPTLVCVRGTRMADADPREYVAQFIPGARLLSLPGEDSLFFAGDPGPLLDGIEEFVTGEHPKHATDRVLSTVMFTDLVESTEHTTRVGDRRWTQLLAAHDSAVRAEVDRFRGREVKTIGDGILATFDGPGRAVICAAAIRDAVRSLGLDIRVGLHTGEIERRGDDIAGIAVVIAKRVEATAPPGEILVTRTVVDLVAGSGLEFAEFGTTQLKGVDEPWCLYRAI